MNREQIQAESIDESLLEVDDTDLDALFAKPKPAKENVQKEEEDMGELFGAGTGGGGSAANKGADLDDELFSMAGAKGSTAISDDFDFASYIANNT